MKILFEVGKLYRRLNINTLLMDKKFSMGERKYRSMYLEPGNIVLVLSSSEDDKVYEILYNNRKWVYEISFELVNVPFNEVAANWEEVVE
jgi:hypothetical protein